MLRRLSAEYPNSSEEGSSITQQQQQQQLVHKSLELTTEGVYMHRSVKLNRKWGVWIARGNDEMGIRLNVRYMDWIQWMVCGVHMTILCTEFYCIRSNAVKRCVILAVDCIFLTVLISMMLSVLLGHQIKFVLARRCSFRWTNAL